MYNYKYILVTLLISLLVKPVVAQEEQKVKVELLSEVEHIQPGKSFWVSFQFTLADHWHIYWINPGSLGLPTKVKWKLPPGFKAGEIHWPYPEKFVSKIGEDISIAYGYEHKTTILAEIHAPETIAEQEVTLNAYVEWLVCSTKGADAGCLPGDKNTSLKLAVKKEAPSVNIDRAKSFAQARGILPIAESSWALKPELKENEILLHLQSASATGLQDVAFYPANNNQIELAAPQKLVKTDMGYTLHLIIATGKQVDRLEGVLYNKLGWRGAGSEKGWLIDISTTGPGIPVAISKKIDTSKDPTQKTKSDDTKKPVTVKGSDEITTLWAAILFAFIGGLILNLMPCVLPILSIKIFSFVKEAGEDKSRIWKHGVVFTMGVLVSFWVLAGILLVLRSSVGDAEAWGFHLQSPTFIICMASVFFIFALNLFGVFEIGTSLVSLGGVARKHSGWTGSFLSGVLATAVGSPCTAPFMGPALTYAVSQPEYVSLTVFTFLGLGLAAPYLIISFNPALLKFVPKPGAWMDVFKHSLGYPLMIAAVWMVWVLGGQAGNNAVATLLIALTLMALGAWIYGTWGSIERSGKSRAISTSVFVILVMFGLGVSMQVADNGVAVKKEEKKQTLELEEYIEQLEEKVEKGEKGIKSAPAKTRHWQPFSKRKFDKLRQQGKAVFIDFTASWCITCQANKVSLRSDKVMKKFEELEVVTLVADFTSKDPELAQEMKKYNKVSVPVYVLYGPGENSPAQVLPQILTPDIVIEALEGIAK